MSVTPLAVGVLTAATDIDDPAMHRALHQMVKDASKTDLEATVYDLTSLVQALCNTLSEQCGVTTQELLTSAFA